MHQLGDIFFFFLISKPKFLFFNASLVVYFISCKNCKSVYTGENDRTAGNRLQCHKHSFKNNDYRSKTVVDALRIDYVPDLDNF